MPRSDKKEQYLLSPESSLAKALRLESTTHTYQPGQRLFQAGDSPRGLFVVISGRIRVIRQVGGRTHLIHTEGPGGTLGEVPLVADGAYPATAEAVNESIVALLPVAAFWRLVRSQPELAEWVMRRLAARVRNLVDRLDAVTARSVSVRLARHLIECATAASQSASPRRSPSAQPSFSLGASQKEVAEELGTVREVLVRELRNLRSIGAILLVGRGRYVVEDMSKLVDAAGYRSEKPGMPYTG
jgi:CRP/FNR family transcriptional regulator